VGKGGAGISFIRRSKTVNKCAAMDGQGGVKVLAYVRVKPIMAHFACNREKQTGGRIGRNAIGGGAAETIQHV
jgi:hypothetical protein